MVDAAKLPIETNVSAETLADAMFGSGIKILKATHTGDPVSAGIFSEGDRIALDVTPSDSGLILSTGRAADFTNSSGEANQTASLSSDTNGVDGDKGLDDIAGAQTFDGAVSEANFVPAGLCCTNRLSVRVPLSPDELIPWLQ